ncbi:MAG: amidohydrolase family protein [Candidatus Sericytochromatia bacterium]
MKRLNSKYIHTGHRLLRDHSLLLSAQGEVLQVLPQAEADRSMPRDAELIELGQRLVIPGCVNTHSHAFQVLLRPTTGQPVHFRDWVDRFLYPLVETLDEDRLYASALLAFSEMLRGGITTVGEFFYVQNLDDGSSSRQRYAHAVIQAARDVGIRLVLLRTLYDQGEKPGQRRFRESAEQALEQTEALARHYADIPGISVAPAPHSLHGASRELIVAGARLAERLGTPWHIHLAEQQGDVPFAEQRYGHRPLECLAEWGILSEQTVLVHGIWLDASEQALMAQHRAMLAYNPLTNMALGDGIAPLPALLEHGITVGLGTDANLQSDLFVEARNAEYLQRSRQLAMGCISDRALFAMLNANGGRVLGQPVGLLEAGYQGDFLVLDPEHPSLLPAFFQADAERALINQLIFSMVPQRAIEQVWMNGVCLQQGDQHVRLAEGEVARVLRQSWGTDSGQRD